MIWACYIRSSEEYAVFLCTQCTNWIYKRIINGNGVGGWVGFIVPAPSPGFSLLFVFEGFGNDPNAISLMCMVGFEASSSFFIYPCFKVLWPSIDFIWVSLSHARCAHVGLMSIFLLSFHKVDTLLLTHVIRFVIFVPWVQYRCWQWLGSSLNRAVKPFINVWQFGGSARFRFELGLARLKLNQTVLGRTVCQTGQDLISSAKPVPKGLSLKTSKLVSA